MVKTDPKDLHKEDRNGWRPLHEAVRGGQVEVVQLLLLYGADLNHITKTGVSPLNIAKEYLAEDHPMIYFLEGLGAKDVWPELYMTMKPGDMVMYESHSVIHGRPYPLQGGYYANSFLRFEPIGHTRKHAEKGAYGTDVELPEQAEQAYEQALAKAKKRSSSTPSSVPDLPHYVSPTLADSWNQNFHFERNEIVSPKPTKQTLGLLTPHLAAADGLLDVLKEIAAKDRSQLFKEDSNGWRPLHEAARAGHAHVVEYLLKEGEHYVCVCVRV
jgi:hypothetical protein